MGTIYRRKDWFCKTCKGNGGKRLARTADRTACEAAGHDIEERESPIYWVKYRRGGKSYAQSSESDVKGKARKLLRRIEGDIEGGKPITPKVGRLTFEDAAKNLLADYSTNGKRSEVVVKRRVTKHLTPFFGGRRMVDITTPLIRQYTVERQTVPSVLVRQAHMTTDPDGTVREVPEERRPASNAEINRELALLKRMFNLATQDGTLLSKPHIPMLDEDNTRKGFFEPEAYRSVLGHLPAEIQPVIEFAYLTGWRIAAEVLPLEWHRVDFDAEEIRLDVGTTKNKAGRVFPFTTDLRRVLDAQKAEHDRMKKAGHICPFVFFREVAEERGGEKKPQRIISFAKAWKKACRKAGCPGRIPHDLRRTAIRGFVRTGIPERVAMQLSGHKTRSVFERYNIVSDGDLREAARKINGAQPTTTAKKRA